MRANFKLFNGFSYSYDERLQLLDDSLPQELEKMDTIGVETLVQWLAKSLSLYNNIANMKRIMKAQASRDIPVKAAERKRLNKFRS